MSKSSDNKSIPGLGWATPKAKFQHGPKTLAIPMSLHRAARKKVAALLESRGVTNGIALIQGGSQELQYDTDIELVFRQDSWFNYLFGVKEAEFYGAISLPSGRCTLFMPRLPSDYLIWCGEIHPPEHFKSMYDVDEVRYSDTLVDFLESSFASEPSDAKLHVMEGRNSDSGLSCKPASFPGDEAFKDRMDTSALFHAVATARVTKSPDEIEAMRYAAFVASNAHVEVMRTTGAGMMEYELEAKFMYEIYKNGGCRKAAYTCICACGPSGAVLHYGHAGAPNSYQLQQQDMALLDMGADYHGYVSDITCSFPISGTFSEKQRAIFTAVLNAQRGVMALARPGVTWVECHKEAERNILQGLVGVGVLSGDIEEMVDAGMGAVFMPHGLGHLIGCDTHDVGGYLDGTPDREQRPGLKNLRTARVLEPNMVLTNEPGCYFINYLLDTALANPTQSRYMNAEVIDTFRGFGGVRLEDVFMITETGVENLTTCPRTVEEVEAVMRGGCWPPEKDAAPELKRNWTRLSADGQSMERFKIE